MGTPVERIHGRRGSFMGVGGCRRAGRWLLPGEFMGVAGGGGGVGWENPFVEPRGAAGYTPRTSPFGSRRRRIAFGREARHGPSNRGTAGVSLRWKFGRGPARSVARCDAGVSGVQAARVVCGNPAEGVGQATGVSNPRSNEAALRREVRKTRGVTAALVVLVHAV